MQLISFGYRHVPGGGGEIRRRVSPLVQRQKADDSLGMKPRKGKMDRLKWMDGEMG